ncbi:MAG: DUF1150 family protein [Alphaproteobacteria bacterium]|nr:DUF1150 family protein [Alphaproteobacteria bacterium]
MTINKESSTTDILKNLSRQDFLTFGRQQVAYIREIRVDDRLAYAIHAADGTPLSVMDSLDAAMIAIRHNDLESAIVH